MRLAGAVSIVTGASSGIGRATALALASHGSHVVLAARREAELAAVAAACHTHGVRTAAVAADVTRRDDVDRLARRAIQEFGHVDLLVNNAGFALYDSIAEADPDDLAGMMATNYLGAVLCTQAVLPSMLARGNGAIVNVASIAGIMGYARMGGYCASKFAMIGFSEALRDEVIGHGIRVSLVCPGTTDTQFFEKAERGKMPAASRLILAIPPERVARAVCRAARRGSYRIVVPWQAALFMRFKEVMPRAAHWLMRNVSSAIERRSS
ncbi:MAG: SDR family NAD(P)-dependent oxidoreductase [Thermoanaerobaculia bacterium]